MVKESLHWADQTARRVIADKGDKDSYTVASGITPSGDVHVGNFREIITTELVARALKSLGKKVRFIYSWDDYDVFRKVPKGMPNQDMLVKHLRQPICDVPDPYEQDVSYADHNIQKLEQSLAPVGIEPEFLYQHKKYRAAEYAEGIKIALREAPKIREIINRFREEPRPDSWLPLFLYNPDTNTDDVIDPTWDGDDVISFTDSTGKSHSLKISEGKYIALPWRVDWPMRWSHEKVDFEPAGKDHSSAGGSFETGKTICKEVYGSPAPTYLMYDFVRIKGGQGKMSSSSGNATLLSDFLEVYEPAMVRWIYAGTRPGSEFAVSFDEDIIKIYEEWDKCERIYYDVETAKNDKETAQQKRNYELSVVDFDAIPSEIPFQPGFRHLTTLVQIYQHDIERVVEWFVANAKCELTPVNLARITTRANCVSNWLKQYASESFVFTVNETFDASVISDEMKPVLTTFVEILKGDGDADSKGTAIWQYCKDNELNIKDFFGTCYQLLISKNKGPKLVQFIEEVGVELFISRLETAMAK